MLEGRNGEDRAMAGNVYLVGMMGAGKTTLGRALAQHTGREFVDTYRLLLDRTGVPVATIFEIEGDEGFRKREAALIAEIAQRSGCIVATGGGAVLAADNRRLMRESGTVVYLRARLENLWERTRHEGWGGVVGTADPRATLATLLEKRDPLYREAAHLVVDTASQAAATLVNRVAAALHGHETHRESP
jgi:shikimate kinase